MPLTLKYLKPNDYPENAQTLGEHLRQRRKKLRLLQRDVAERMDVSADAVANWEKGTTRPMPSQFRPIVAFLGYDPTPPPTSLAERFEAKRRRLGATLDQVARHLGWDEGSLRRYLKGTRRLSPDRAAVLGRFLELERSEAAAVGAMPRRRR